MSFPMQMTFDAYQQYGAEQDTVLRIEQEEFDELLRTGTCRTKNHTLDVPIRGRSRCLFYDDEGIEGDFYDDAAKFVISVLKRAVIGIYDDGTCTVDTTSSMHDLLFSAFEANSPDPDQWERRIERMKAEKDFEAPLHPGFWNKTEYVGRVRTCDCGEPLCGSEFAWIKNAVCLVIFSTSCDIIRKFKTFPYL